MREYTAKEEGYVLMYVSNENATLVDVYFDDIVMTYLSLARMLCESLRVDYSCLGYGTRVVFVR